MVGKLASPYRSQNGRSDLPACARGGIYVNMPGGKRIDIMGDWIDYSNDSWLGGVDLKYAEEKTAAGAARAIWLSGLAPILILAHNRESFRPKNQGFIDDPWHDKSTPPNGLVGEFLALGRAEGYYGAILGIEQ